MSAGQTGRENRKPTERQAPEPRRSAEEDGELQEPRKRHGDALLDGTGNRHGVHQRDREPDTCG